ncbi:MAG: HAD-IA family hydrolase [Planctomycetes bacterium]|nr:HAD-IA family hydrolase [Planctomycetota bacterium]MBT4028329.1 HAD-IA family hydrolase [Planctomycetota bacterium]MBT4560878.1 HAD-IA family hydrolase [Planctomycetota bacterium]MBT5119089.1 HAD-IA family hydrolase [Planctomycetota bacterium]MBT7012693.1 HAD-IA family hydrolase [Planctomycetota bacterium]
MTAQLSALFFDVDDTLFSTTEFVARARDKAVEAMLDRGLLVDKDVILAELAAVVLEFGSNDTQHYNRLLQRLPKRSLRGTNPSLLVHAGVMAYHETKWQELHIPEETSSLLASLLRVEGLELGVITSGLAHKQMEKILRLGLDRFVRPDLLFITDQVGIAKSNPELYRRACDRAGASPEHSMHVGDHPLNDIIPAQAAGLTTVWHRGVGKYDALREQMNPTYRISCLSELRQLLVEDFQLPLD